MGIRITTLMLCGTTGRSVEIHGTGRIGKIKIHNDGKYLTFGFVYEDDPEKKEYTIHFDGNRQGYVQDSEIDEIEDEPSLA